MSEKSKIVISLLTAKPGWQAKMNAKSKWQQN